MKNLLFAAMLAASSQSAAADWEMVPETEFCIARNSIDWGDGNIGETRFGWHEELIFLSAINLEWDIKTSPENPFEEEAVADFDGKKIPVIVLSTESHTLIVAIEGSAQNLDTIVNSNVMKIYPKGSYEQYVFGFELDKMTQAVSLVGQCYFTTKA